MNDRLRITMIYRKALIAILATCVFFVFGVSSDLEYSDTLEYVGNRSCVELLESYANASAGFTYCAVKFARPIRICESCVTSYQDVITAHDNILQIEDGRGNTKCKEKLTNLDRLEIIEEGFRYISDLWDRASCSYCFDANNETFHLTNNTIKFMDLYNKTFTCFSNHQLDGNSYNQSVCEDCESSYCDMNKFYDGLKSTQDTICMDVVDSMNITRMLWNDKLKCKKDTHTFDIIYLACSCVVAAMPILFYLSAGLFTTVIRNRLQMQKRLAEILKPSTSTETQR